MKKLKPHFFVALDDEIPAAGAGFRGIAVLKIGRKWAQLVITGTQEKARVPVKLWAELPKHVYKRGKLTGEIVF